MNQKSLFRSCAVYSDSKDLTKRTISDRVLEDKSYEIARNCKYDDIKQHQEVWSIRFLIKKGLGVSLNEQLAEKLHKPVIKKLIKEKSMQDLKTIFGQKISLKWSLSSKNWGAKC